MKTKNNNKWFYNVESWKGSIPSDKIHKNKIAFEIGFKNYFMEAQKSWMSIKYDYAIKKLDEKTINIINRQVDKFVKDYKIKETKEAIFYFNFNFNGIDVFVNRWLDTLD